MFESVEAVLSVLCQFGWFIRNSVFFNNRHVSLPSLSTREGTELQPETFLLRPCLIHNSVFLFLFLLLRTTSWLLSISTE